MEFFFTFSICWTRGDGNQWYCDLTQNFFGFHNSKKLLTSLGPMGACAKFRISSWVERTSDSFTAQKICCEIIALILRRYLIVYTINWLNFCCSNKTCCHKKLNTAVAQKKNLTIYLTKKISRFFYLNFIWNENSAIVTYVYDTNTITILNSQFEHITGVHLKKCFQVFNKQ